MILLFTLTKKKKVKPKIVPIKNLPVFNFVEILKVNENQNPRKGIPTKENGYAICPYKGRVISKENVIVFGFSLTHKTTLCTIDNNGNVVSRDGSYGWIDNTGQIHKGVRRNQSSVFTQGEIVGRILNQELYLENIRVGKLVKTSDSHYNFKKRDLYLQSYLQWKNTNN